MLVDSLKLKKLTNLPQKSVFRPLCSLQFPPGIGVAFKSFSMCAVTTVV